MRPRTAINVPGFRSTLEPSEAILEYSGIDAALREITRDLVCHHRAERDPHTWLDIILSDIIDIKKARSAGGSTRSSGRG